MELQHLIVKIPVAGQLAIDPAAVVDVFHRWVAAQSVPGVLLIDVAELLHVPNGPGVIAVGYEADFALDHTDGIWGVLHRRKTPLSGTNAERVAQAFYGAGRTGAGLEEAFAGALKFSRTDFQLIVNDRALAPNTPETAAAAIPEIESAVRSLLSHDRIRVTPAQGEARQRFGVTVHSDQPFAFPVPAGPGDSAGAAGR
jgi:hypothetical protein